MLYNAKACKCWLKIVPLSPIVHSGANRHGSEVRTGYVSKVFWERWIGHVSLVPAPLDWPLQTPDLSLFDHSLLGFLKETVAHLHTNCWRPSASSETTFKLVNYKCCRQCPTEHSAELFCVMRMIQHSKGLCHVQSVIRSLHFYGE